MYTQFYELEQKPFALLPDPRFLYLGGAHREALAHLLEGIEHNEGLALLLGPTGSGKTTLCCTLLDRLSGGDTEVALVSHVVYSPLELLAAVHRALGLSAAGAHLELLVGELAEFLRKGRCAGRRALLVIDGAHTLSLPVLGAVRALAELQDEGAPLLRVLLIGEPELVANLDAVGLRQRVHTEQELAPLGRVHCDEYVAHRLRVAGRRGGSPLFRGAALRALHAASGGTPRAINAIADRALELAAEKGLERIDARPVRVAARELHAAVPAPRRAPSPRLLRAARRAVAACLVCGALGATGLRFGEPAVERLGPAWSGASARLQLVALDWIDGPAYRAIASRPQP